MFVKVFELVTYRRAVIGAAALACLIVAPGPYALANDQIVRGLFGIGTALQKIEAERRASGNSGRAQPSSSAQRNEPSMSRDEVFALQSRLNALGFNTGTPDGGIGSNTRRGIRMWQAARGDQATGYLTQSQASALLAEADAPLSLPGGQEDVLRPSEMAQLQQRLNEFGYDVGRPDGVSGPRTGRAIAAFLTEHGHDPYQTSVRAAYELAVDGRDPATGIGADGQARTIFSGEAVSTSAPGASAALANPDDYPLTGRDAPVDMDHEIALRALATMPTLAEDREFVKRLFESEHPSPIYSSRGDRSPRSLKYWRGTPFDKQDVLGEYAAELAARAVTAPLKVTLTEKLTLGQGYVEGAGYPVRFGQFPRLSGVEYDFHSRLLSSGILMVLPNAPKVDMIPATTEGEARRLADAFADSQGLELRLMITVNSVGPDRPAGRRGDIYASATLDGLAVYGYSRSLKQHVELYRWDVAPREAAAVEGLDLAEAVSFFGLPVSEGRLALIQSRFRNLDSAPWQRLQLMARLGAYPELLDTDEVAFSYAANALTAGEKAELAQGSAVFQAYQGGIDVLNEFERVRFYQRLRENYSDLIRGRVPNLPYPVVEAYEGTIGDYDFESQSFVLNTYGPSGGAAQEYYSRIPKATSALGSFPTRLQMDADRGEQLVSMLQDRRIYFAVYSQMSFESQSPDAFNFALAPERISLFADSGLTQHVADFALEPLMQSEPAPEDPGLVAARGDAQTILSKPIIEDHVLAALSRAYSAADGYFDAYINSSRQYRNANEFDRNSVRAEVESQVLASVRDEAQEFWLGGEIGLGEYNFDRQAFPITSSSVTRMGSSVDSFDSSISLSIYNREALSELPMAPEAAQEFAERSNRTLLIRQLVEPVGASWNGDSGRDPKLQFVYRLKEAYVLNGSERNPGSVTKIIARLEGTKPVEIAAQDEQASDASAEWKGSTGRPLLNQDMLLALAARKAAHLDEQAINWLLTNRFVHDFEIRPSLPKRFFAEDAPTPVPATRERFVDPFRQWLDNTPESLPEQLTLVWDRGSNSNSTLRPAQCHFLSSKPITSKMPDAFGSDSYSDIFEAQVNEINKRHEADPLIVRPAYLEFNFSSGIACASGSEAGRFMSKEFGLDRDDGNSWPLIQIVVDQLPMPPSNSLGNLAEIDVTLDAVEIVDNGGGVPHVLVKTRFENVRFIEVTADAGGNQSAAMLGSIGIDDINKPTFAERTGAMPDILGISAGQTMEEADAILRAHFDEPRVLDTSRPAMRPNQSFQDARIYLRQDGLEYVALFRDPAPENADKIVGVSRQMIAPADMLSPDALISSLHAKFGPEDLFSQSNAWMAWGDNVYRIDRSSGSREETACRVRQGNNIPIYWSEDGQETDHLAQLVPWNDVRDYSFFMWPEFTWFPSDELLECGAYARVEITARQQTGFWMFVGDIGAYARGQAARDAAPREVIEPGAPKLDLKL